MYIFKKGIKLVSLRYKLVIINEFINLILKKMLPK